MKDSENTNPTTNQISFFRPSDITWHRRLGHARQQHFLVLESFSEFKRRCFKDGEPKISDLSKMEELLLHQLHCHILFSAKIYHVCTIINYTYCTWYFSTTQVWVISVTPGRVKQLKISGNPCLFWKNSDWHTSQLGHIQLHEARIDLVFPRLTIRPNKPGSI